MSDSPTLGHAMPETGLEPEAVAVIGMAGRFPGAADLATFWQNIRQSVESVRFFTTEDLKHAGVPQAVYEHPAYVPAKAQLDDMAAFDAEFFGFNAREATLTDPQQRLFLECAWEALEDAGHDPQRFPGRIGVYAGQSMNTYLLHHAIRDPAIAESFYLDHLSTMTGAKEDFLATRVAYELDLDGPAMTVQTACSTSLVAVHQACQCLLGAEADLVLAGGVSVTVPDPAGYVYQEGSALSPDGHCRAFDRSASGIVGGNGLGVVVLRRLSDAMRDGDVVYAVIRGSAVNNDGADKSGFTAPSVTGQARVVTEALGEAEISADSVGYVEAHGTATPLGDPIEVAALTQAFRADTDRAGYCALGSVKTNVGHLDAAAGVAGFIKAALAVRGGVVPPTLHFREPNPRLELDSSPFHVSTRLESWPIPGIRRAGVSSLGVGGTNAHVVLEEPPHTTQPATDQPPRSWQLILVSGRTSAARNEAAWRLASAVEGAGNATGGETLAGMDHRALADTAYTLQVGRRAFAYRRAVVGRKPTEIAAALRIEHPDTAPAMARTTVLLFPGGGSQYVGMGRALYAAEPGYAAAVDACAEIARARLGYDLRTLLLGDPDDAVAVERLTSAPGMLAALFTVDYAFARLWGSWGVRPDAILGHSLGEYVGACMAGVFDLHDAIETVLVRGQLLDALPAGAMLAVALPETELRPLLGPKVCLAAVNAPDQCAVSGVPGAVEELERLLIDRDVACRRARVHQPVHSAQTEPILDRFTAHLRGITLRPPHTPFISNVTGDWISEHDATDPAYWVRQLREPVRFADGMRRLLELPNVAVIEAGPSTTLGMLAEANLAADDASPPIAGSLPHPRDPTPEPVYLLGSLGRLWSAGVEVDWPAYWQDRPHRRCALPTYPFQRRRYWLDAAPTGEYVGTQPADGQELPTPTTSAGTGPIQHPRPPLLTTYIAANGDPERALVQDWQDLLGYAPIGVDDNFYALGGSSLLLTRLLARLRDRYGVRPTVAEFLTTQTVGEQAKLLHALLRTREGDRRD